MLPSPQHSTITAPQLCPQQQNSSPQFLKKYNNQTNQLYLSYAYRQYKTSQQLLISLSTIDSTWKACIKKLNLSNNELGDKGVKMFVMGGGWENLEVLYLGSNYITAVGAKYLANIGDFKNMTKIVLQFNQLGAAGMKNLTKANWSKLEQIWVQSNHLSCQATLYFSHAKWPKLKILALCNPSHIILS